MTRMGRSGLKLFGVLLCFLGLAALAPAPALSDTQEIAKTIASDLPGRFEGVFDEGVQAWDAGQYEKAHDLWLSIATQGDLAAMRNLAHLLRLGLGVETNAEEAARWYSRAAERGLTGAQVNLAELFHDGNGVPQSYKLAAQWYARAARAGHAHAQYKLGRMIEDGHTSAGNTELAKKLYGWAIDAGHSGALERYRQLDAREGAIVLEVPETTDEASLDLETSTSLKTLAGAGDTPKADSFLFRRQDKDALMEAQQHFVRGERSSAVTKWRALALQSSSEAQYRLALALLQGHGVRKDDKEAAHWLDVAATGGHRGAADLLIQVTLKTP